MSDIFKEEREVMKQALQAAVALLSAFFNLEVERYDTSDVTRVALALGGLRTSRRAQEEIVKTFDTLLPVVAEEAVANALKKALS